MYDTVENLSTIQTSSNRIDSDSDTDTGKYSYEYHSHGSTNNSSTIPNKKFSNSAQTDTAHVKQQDKNTQIKPSYEYVTINKKWNKDKIKEKKLDKKDEEKNSNDDNNKNSNESQIPTFLKGVGTTLTTEFIFFIVWSAYYYWHQSIMMAKEKNIEDLNPQLNPLLSVEDITITLIKPSKKIKNIFDEIFDKEEESKESKEEDYFDIDEKLINLNAPIYRNETEYNLLEPPKILEEIVATPFFITSFKQINLLIKADSEYFLAHTKNFNESQNFETSNSNIDAIEI